MTLPHFEAPSSPTDELRQSMRKAFENIVHPNTCDLWTEDLFKYDPYATLVVTAHFSGVRRPLYNVVHYKDRWDNILTFIIRLR